MKTYPNFWQALIYTLLILGISIIYFMLIPKMLPFFIKNDLPVIIFDILKQLGRVIYFIPILIFLKNKSKINFAVQLKRAKIHEIIITILFATFLYASMFFIKLYFSGHEFKIENFGLSNLGWRNSISALLLAPILEELFFRGVILHQFLKQYNKHLAILLSSLLFAISHLSLSAIISMFIFSVLLSYLYSRFSYSLIVAILFHFTWNFLSLMGQW